MPNEQQHGTKDSPTTEESEILESTETYITETDWVHPNPPIQEGYANHVGLSVSVWDITMDFGTIVGINPANRHLQVVRRIRLSVSPETARALELQLAEALQNYEAKFGKIRFPPAGEGQARMFNRKYEPSIGEEAKSEDATS
jgi:hypothetical protein